MRIMKITYISQSALPSRTANSIHVMKMCRAFAGNGIDVVLLAPDNRKAIELGIPDIYAFYGIEPAFKITKLWWANNKYQECIYGFLAGLYAKKRTSDIVYARDHVGAYWASLLGINVIFEAHGPPCEGSGRMSAYFFNRLMRSGRLKKLVVISHSLREYYRLRYPYNKDKIQVLSDAADPVPEDLQPHLLPNKHKRPQVGYIGHLYKGRGVNLIMEIARACTWADFHLVGGTEDDIAHWRNSTEHAQNIFLHGFVPYAEAESFRVAFDVLLAPYQEEVSVENRGNTAQWMSPIKIFEYLAVGKPIICSDLPVIHEVLQHGRNALLCPPNDAGAWITALTLLAHDEGMRNKLGADAKKFFLENHTWDSRVKKILDQH